MATHEITPSKMHMLWHLHGFSASDGASKNAPLSEKRRIIWPATSVVAFFHQHEFSWCVTFMPSWLFETNCLMTTVGLCACSLCRNAMGCLFSCVLQPQFELRSLIWLQPDVWFFQKCYCLHFTLRHLCKFHVLHPVTSHSRFMCFAGLVIFWFNNNAKCQCKKLKKTSAKKWSLQVEETIQKRTSFIGEITKHLHCEMLLGSQASPNKGVLLKVSTHSLCHDWSIIARRKAAEPCGILATKQFSFSFVVFCLSHVVTWWCCDGSLFLNMPCCQMMQWFQSAFQFEVLKPRVMIAVLKQESWLHSVETFTHWAIPWTNSQDLTKFPLLTWEEGGGDDRYRASSIVSNHPLHILHFFTPHHVGDKNLSMVHNGCLWQTGPQKCLQTMAQCEECGQTLTWSMEDCVCHCKTVIVKIFCH